MATGANRVPLGRLHPAMSKKRNERDSQGGSPGLISQHAQHVQRSQQGYSQPQPPLPPQPAPGQHYNLPGMNPYAPPPPLPPMPMQPPLPPAPIANPYGNQPPPPPPPQTTAIESDTSHQQMLEYMQRIPQQRAEAARAESRSDSPADQPIKKKKRRSRWGDSDEKTRIPGMPVALPSHLTEDQQKQYLLHFKIEEISIKLRSGNLGIPPDPDDRSPSPEPIYNSEGKRLNTREFRVRKFLEEERHSLILKAYDLNQEYKPPADYKPPSSKIQDKVMIPQDKNPTINFIGLLIGPRGNTLKKMEKDTNCKIIIRGKGSVKEGKVGRPGGPLPGEDEPLHALVTGPSHSDVKKAVDTITKIIKEGIECPESANELRRMQLRELAALNGTLIEEDMVRCRNCGSTEHRHWECTEQKNVTNMVVCTKCGGYGHVETDCVYQSEVGEATQTFEEKVKMDEEYMSLMAELQGGDPAAAAVAAKESAQTSATKPPEPMSAPNPGAVSAPWNALPPPPPSSSSDPPSLLGKPPPNQTSMLQRPIPTNSGPPGGMPPPLMQNPPAGVMPPSSQPPWMANPSQPPKPSGPTNFGSPNPGQNAPRPPIPPMPGMMPMHQGMPPAPPGTNPMPPMSASNGVTPSPNQPPPAAAPMPAPWQTAPMNLTPGQGYMMPGMNAYTMPPPPPPPPGTASPAMPPWAGAPPPPPPPPS